MRNSSASRRTKRCARPRRATARSSKRARTRSSSTTGTRGAIVDVNHRSLREHYGFSRDELLRLRLADLSSGMPPYTDEDGLRWIERAKSEGSARFEWLRRSKDGSLHWDEVRLKAARIGGQPRLLVFAREITERKLREQALRASEEQYRTVFNASADALVLWNSRSERVDVNPAYERMYGYSRARGAGRVARTRAARGVSAAAGRHHPPHARRRQLLRRDRDRAARRGALSDRGAHRPDPASRRAARAGDDPRPDRAPAGRGGARPARGAAAPGAEDGGDRPAHRRHRARLQQPAHQHHGLRGARRRTRSGDRRPAPRGLPRAGTTLLRAGARPDPADAHVQPRAARHAAHGRARALVEAALASVRPALPSTVELAARHVGPGTPPARVDPLQFEQVLLNLCINARDAFEGAGHRDGHRAPAAGPRLRVPAAAAPWTANAWSCASRTPGTA